MPKRDGQLLEKTSWEAVRQEAARRNMPAWMLAESLAVHEQDGELVMVRPSTSAVPAVAFKSF